MAKKKRKGASPTQLTIKHLKKRGYETAIVEHWNHFSCIRKDLFGFIDVVALGNMETLAVQTTSRSNMSARRRKILSLATHRRVIEAGWTVVIHGWAKKGNRWELKEETVSYASAEQSTTPDGSGKQRARRGRSTTSSDSGSTSGLAA